MTFHLQLDAEGKIQIPAEIRDALRLHEGSAVALDHEDADTARLRFSAEAPSAEDASGVEPYLIWENGFPVIVGLAPETAEETVAAIKKMREDRDRHVSGPYGDVAA